MGETKYQVIVSPQAAQMLVSHAAFLAQVSPAAAERLVTAFEEAATALEIMPNRCPWFNRSYIPQNKYRQYIFEKRYIILFQVIGDKVYADHVLDARQDYDWLLQ